ncbi:hypothetical protein J3R80_14190 [Aliiroseovarius sp. Z3]|uniref:glycosyl transferase family 90 n=1 Tax=Aliiroseovarius sp. Z3 TaxID=2811402 RepID=UPI0023B2439F|nr:glycosyl transferase family 90 [Aliiroseovarius sp. Z3]MDE9451621.1 hypothetical protein [Aliiroseovarius sp. Z3]
MVTRAEFIETSVRHQLGEVSDARRSGSQDAVDYAKSASSGMALHWDHQAGAPGDFNGWRLEGHILRKSGAKVNREKTAGALFGVLEHAPDYSFLVDMADHRTRSLISPTGEVAPVFSFNRPVVKRTGRILWPLPDYHDLEGDAFLGKLDPTRVPWGDKSDLCVWRGGPGNRGRLGRHARGKSIRLLPLLRKYKKGELSAEETETALMSMSRYRIVRRYINDPRFDIGYTNSDGIILKDQPFVSDLERPRISREACQTYRYILVLPGNDVASSLYWTLNSGSVALVMDCEFETFATHHFKPWEHYVPIRRDLRDLEQNLAWCQSHPDECQQMTARAGEVCKMLADGDMRDEVLRQVVHRVGAQLAT